MAPPGKKVDNALASMLLASMAISMALFGAPNSINNAMAAASANKNTEVKANSVSSLLATPLANPFDHACLDITAAAPGTDGACAYCKNGCFLNDPSTEVGACPVGKADLTSLCDLKEQTPEQKQTMNETMKAKQKIPRGADCTGDCLKFLGQDDVFNPDSTKMTAYFIGIITPALFFLFLGICSCLGLCNFCCARCPCGPEYKSDDTCIVALCKCFGTNTFCPVTSHDNIVVALVKCIICPGCPNPLGCICCCCCPAKPVVNFKPEGEGNFVYSGGIKACGDPQYATNYAGRTEPMNCCGGVYPSIQYASCGCGEWGCCCDCCFGCCECFNPCCRLNLFDYERATGGDPGYSLNQGRLLTLVFIVIIIFLIVGMSTVGVGKDLFLCGLKTFMPSVVNVFDALIGWIVSLVFFLIKVATILDATIAQAGIEAALIAPTLQDALAPAVQAVYGIKETICPLSGDLGIDAGFSAFVDVTSYLGFLVMILGVLGWLCSNSLARLSLSGATLGVIAGFLSIFLYVIVDPLSLLLSDVCVLLNNLKTKGAMEGFPGSPPDFCGPNGTMKAFPEQTANIAIQAQMFQCQAYSELCNAAIMPGGIFGSYPTVVCPDQSDLATDRPAFYFDRNAVPVQTPSLEFVNCLEPVVPTFYKKFIELKADKEGTKLNNMRFGCYEKKYEVAEAQTRAEVARNGVNYIPEIVNYNKINVEADKCMWTFNALSLISGNTAATGGAPAFKNMLRKFAKSDLLRKEPATITTRYYNEPGYSDGINVNPNFGPGDQIFYETPTMVCGTGHDGTRTAPSDADKMVYVCYGGPAAATGEGIGWNVQSKKRLAGYNQKTQPKDSATLVISPSSGKKFSVTTISNFVTEATLSTQTQVSVSMAWKSQANNGQAGCIEEGKIIGSKDNILVNTALAATFVEPVGVSDTDESFSFVPGKSQNDWSTDTTKYRWVPKGGMCVYTVESAEIELGQANVGCSKIKANRPMPCELTTPTIAQCGSPTDPKCDDKLMRMKTGALQGFNDVIAQVAGINRYYSKPYGFDCAGEADAEAVQLCDAGRAMYEVVYCGILSTFATEMYDSICVLMTGGLMNMATGFLTFFLGYNLAFITFLLGYKRWNTHYTEGYRVDLDGDGKKDGENDGYISDARSDTAGVSDGDKKGMIGAMCDSLKQGCKGQYHPKPGDVLVFGDGENGSVEVSEDMAKKKSGFSLSKKNSVVPMGGE